MKEENKKKLIIDLTSEEGQPSIKDFVERCKHFKEHLDKNSSITEKDVTKEFLFWYVVYEPFSDLGIEIAFENLNGRVRIGTDESYLSYTPYKAPVIYFTDKSIEMKSYTLINDLIERVDEFLKAQGISNIVDAIITKYDIIK